MAATMPERQDQQQPNAAPDPAAPGLAARVTLPTQPAVAGPGRPAGQRCEPLAESECLHLLGSVPLGRLAYTERDRPAITIGRHRLQGRDLIIALPAELPATSVRWQTVTFQSDAIDYTTGAGWSVTARGEARPLPPGPEYRRLSATLLPDQPEPATLIRLKIETINGRQLQPTWTWPTPHRVRAEPVAAPG